MKRSKHKLTFLLVSFFISSTLTEQDYCDKSEAKCCRTFVPINFNKSSRSIFVIKPLGRLGNHITAFAHLYQLREDLGVDVFMLNETKHLMSPVFSEATLQILPVLEDEFCNSDDIPFQNLDFNLQLLVKDESYRKGHILSLMNKLNEKTATYQDYLRRLTNSMRRVLQFRPEILEKVHSKMNKIDTKFREKHPTINAETPLTWIGIHNRRTDLSQYAWKKHGLVPLEEEYFVEAMDYFRERFGEAVVFLYVSDDMKWGRQNLMNPKRDLFFVGTGKTEDKDDIAFDMTLLAQCNHSVTTRGTFGIWASILTNGLVYHEDGVTKDLFYI